MLYVKAISRKENQEKKNCCWESRKKVDRRTRARRIGNGDRATRAPFPPRHSAHVSKDNDNDMSYVWHVYVYGWLLNPALTAGLKRHGSEEYVCTLIDSTRKAE